MYTIQMYIILKGYGPIHHVKKKLLIDFINHILTRLVTDRQTDR